jgi:hypothetical protein
MLIGSASSAEPVPSAPAATPGALPPEQITTIVRSSGLHPLGPATARGPTYVVRAADRRAEIVRVVVDARSGEILSVIPVVEGGQRGIGASGPPPPYRPGTRIAHPGADAVDPGAPPPPAARSPREIAATPGGPPLPRPRPIAPSAVPVTPAAPDETAKAPEAEPKNDLANKPKP